MIVAIVAKSDTGRIVVDSFREAASVEDALAEFCASYAQPQNPAAWSAIDTGWAQYQYAADGCVWYYDYDASALVALDAETGVAHDSLAFHKDLKIVQIDARTDAMIDRGFTFGGIIFSLSLKAQMRIEGMDRFRNDPLCEYPVSWNSLDDTQHLSIPDAATLHVFYLTAAGTLRACVDSGTALKDLVRAAATIAEVDAIVDSR